MITFQSSLSPKASHLAALLAGLSLIAGFTLSIPRAMAGGDDLIVKFDQSQLLKLPKPAAEIIIGNPSIADVAIQTGNLLVITGKSFGVTNIIALDAERNVIQDQRIMVRRDEVSMVHVYKSANRSSFNCVPQCNPAIVIGDDQTFFATTKQMSEAKMSFNERSAADSQSNQGQQ